MTTRLNRRSAMASLTGLGLAGFATAGTVRAQSTPSADSPSGSETVIVVSATGQASAPATHAVGQLILRAQNAPIPIDPAAGSVSPEADAKPVVTQNDLDTLIGILVGLGVDPTMIVSSKNDSPFANGFYGPGSGVIAFQVNGEAMKSLPTLLEALMTGATELTLLFDPPGAMYLSDTCEDLRGAAFEDAVINGREEATLMANALGVSLGNLVRVAKQMVMFGPSAYGYINSDACDDLISLGTATRSFLPAFDPELASTFDVFASFEFTFATA